MGAIRLDVREALRSRGRPALAWEVLRRNPGYQSAYRAFAAAGDIAGLADRAFTARWGLHFR